MAMNLIIRKIENRDREVLFSWVTGLGWNPGIKDGECLLATDPDGMLLAELDGVPVGCATAIVYDDRFGYVGTLVVDPALRGKAQRVVTHLYRRTLEYFGERNFGVDALPITQKFSTGVGNLLAYRHLRFEGPITLNRLCRDIVPLLEIPFEDICDYDAACFPARREKFWRIWLNAYGAGGFACRRHGRLAGFGVLRRALRGFRIGPLLADHVEIAEELLQAMGTLSGHDSVALDLPEANAAAVALVERLGWVRGFDTARMYSRLVPHLPLERIFGIASYEFG